MKEFLFKLPSRVHFGFFKTRELPGVLKQMNVLTALLVVDGGLSNNPILHEIMESLPANGIAIEVFDEIQGLPNVMIPTTSGTGAEVTPNAILRDEQEECKVSMVSPYLIPDVVILDPQLTLTLPPKSMAETGIDAFTHCIECFIGNQSNPMSDLFAMGGMKLAFASLRTVVREGSDRKARYDMALASLYGGIAITNSGTAAVDALAYPLGGKYAITHGLSNVVMLADVIDFNAFAVPEKFLRIADSAMSLPPGLTSKERGQAVLEEIRSMVQDVGIRRPEIDLSSGTLDFLASNAMAYQRLLVNNPRCMNTDDAREIYRKAFAQVPQDRLDDRAASIA